MFAVFVPKDIYLDELMSTACSVHVGGWAGVGPCSAEDVHARGKAARPDPPPGGSGSIAGTFVVTPSKPVKRHKGPFY